MVAQVIVRNRGTLLFGPGDHLRGEVEGERPGLSAGQTVG